MTLTKTDIAVAVYGLRTEVDTAVERLHEAGFEMWRISLVGIDQDAGERVVGFINAGGRARIVGKLGISWGALPGTLFGSALMFVPGMGHVIVFGPLASALAGGLRDALLVTGRNPLSGALAAVGTPTDAIRIYEDALKAHKFVLVVHGGGRDIDFAWNILKTTGLISFDHHRREERALTAAYA